MWSGSEQVVMQADAHIPGGEERERERKRESCCCFCWRLSLRHILTEQVLPNTWPLHSAWDCICVCLHVKETPRASCKEKVSQRAQREREKRKYTTSALQTGTYFTEEWREESLEGKPFHLPRDAPFIHHLRPQVALHHLYLSISICSQICTLHPIRTSSLPRFHLLCHNVITAHLNSIGCNLNGKLFKKRWNWHW